METENTKASSKQKLEMNKGLMSNHHAENFAKKKKGVHGGGGSISGTSRCCQAEECTVDLTEAKQYHRRHKVCELHAKAQAVVVAGTHQRFCQQCSRLVFSLYNTDFFYSFVRLRCMFTIHTCTKIIRILFKLMKKSAYKLYRI